MSAMLFFSLAPVRKTGKETIPKDRNMNGKVFQMLASILRNTLKLVCAFFKQFE